MEKQVDAIMGFGSSSLPVILSKGVPVRWMLYSSAGMRTYGQTITTQPKTLETEPALCEAMTEAASRSGGLYPYQPAGVAGGLPEGSSRDGAQQQFQGIRTDWARHVA